MSNMNKPASLAAALFLSVVGVDAQIGAAGTVDTSIASADHGLLALVGSTPYAPYLYVTVGSGAGTSIGADMQDFFSGHAPGEIGYSFSSLYLDTENFVSGASSGTSVSPYLPQVGSTFAFTLNGQSIAVGQIQTFTIYTDFDTGLATGEGTVLLSGPGVGPDFYSEVNAITGGANLVSFTINSFVALSGNSSSAQFASDGAFSFPAAVPEPASAAALAGGLALAGVACRRRRA